MKLFITPQYFLSVIETEDKTYSCQLMQLLHGIGGTKATMFEDQEDVVSSIVFEDEVGDIIVNANVKTLQEVITMHTKLLKSLYLNNNF